MTGQFDTTQVDTLPAEVVKRPPTPYTGPQSLLVMGKVPDISRRYVAAITKDEAEFRRAFPEYKRLLAEGKHREAGSVLHIENVNVGTAVEGPGAYDPDDDTPGVGTFFLGVRVAALRKWGWCLTFLSYEPKPGDDVVDLGYGLGDTIHGVLVIEEEPADESGIPEYTLKIVKAKVTR